MTNDLQAARERWKRGVYPVVGADGYLIERSRDAYLLADAYCELFDETPITEEWLDAIPQIEWHETSAFGWFVQLGERVEGGNEIQGHVQSRGQVRCLLLAMGVTHGEK